MPNSFRDKADEEQCEGSCPGICEHDSYPFDCSLTVNNGLYSESEPTNSGKTWAAATNTNVPAENSMKSPDKFVE